jgi:hypothetical protein
LRNKSASRWELKNIPFIKILLKGTATGCASVTMAIEDGSTAEKKSEV